MFAVSVMTMTLMTLADGYAAATGVPDRAALAPVVGGIAIMDLLASILAAIIPLISSCIAGGGGTPAYNSAKRIIQNAKSPTLGNQLQVDRAVRTQIRNQYGPLKFRKQNGPALREAVFHAGANTTPEKLLALHQHAQENGLT